MITYDPGFYLTTIESDPCTLESYSNCMEFTYTYIKMRGIW